RISFLASWRAPTTSRSMIFGGPDFDGAEIVEGACGRGLLSYEGRDGPPGLCLMTFVKTVPMLSEPRVLGDPIVAELATWAVRLHHPPRFGENRRPGLRLRGLGPGPPADRTRRRGPCDDDHGGEARRAPC